MTDAEILSALIAGGFTLFLILLFLTGARGMTDAEIAAKLTKAQREVIYTLRKCDGISSRHIAAHRVRPLIRRGLINRIERPGFSTWYELTSAGRALLKETNDE